MMLFFLKAICVLFLIRFHLDIARFNYVTSITRFIWAVTTPLMTPFTVLVPRRYYAVTALLACLSVVLILLGSLSLLIAGKGVPIVRLSFLIIFDAWYNLLFLGLIATAILSWIPSPDAARLHYFLSQIIEPLVKPIRAFIPAFGGIDFSFMVLLFGLYYVKKVLMNIIFMIPF